MLNFLGWSIYILLILYAIGGLLFTRTQSKIKGSVSFVSLSWLFFSILLILIFTFWNFGKANLIWSVGLCLIISMTQIGTFFGKVMFEITFMLFNPDDFFTKEDQIQHNNLEKDSLSEDTVKYKQDRISKVVIDNLAKDLREYLDHLKSHDIPFIRHLPKPIFNKLLDRYGNPILDEYDEQINEPVLNERGTQKYEFIPIIILGSKNDAVAAKLFHRIQEVLVDSISWKYPLIVQYLRKKYKVDFVRYSEISNEYLIFCSQIKE